MKNGGPVFPSYDIIHDAKTGMFAGLGTKSEGISLRDYFAGQVLAGSVSGRNMADQIDLMTDYITSKVGAQQHAEEAYFIADAMLAEREKQGVNNG